MRVFVALLFLLSACGHNLTPQTPTDSVQSFSAGVPMHVMTGVYGWGYNGVSTSVPLSYQAQYVTWAYVNGSTVKPYRAAGIHTLQYKNFWRNYDYGGDLSVNYPDIAPHGAHAAAEAKSCNGQAAKDPNYNGGYLNDPQTSAAVGHALVVINNGYIGADAIFSDDTAAAGGVTPSICSFSAAAWLSATKSVLGQIPYQFFVNALNAWNPGSTPAMQVMAESDNTLGALCESCYLNNAGPVTGSHWTAQEQAEIASVQAHKIFWDYARNTTPAITAAGHALRLYGYASFLLTYDPAYAMYETALYTPSAFPIMPEFSLVPESPTATYAGISNYLMGSVYIRQFKDCYYSGSRVGSCAVVVNPSPYTQHVPLSYPYSLSLSGGGVREGGSVSFRGPKVSSLAANSAAIFIGP